MGVLLPSNILCGGEINKSTELFSVSVSGRRSACDPGMQKLHCHCFAICSCQKNMSALIKATDKLGKDNILGAFYVQQRKKKSNYSVWLQFSQFKPIHWTFLVKRVKLCLVSRNAVSQYDFVCKKNGPAFAGLCICMQQTINMTSFHLSEMNRGEKNT